MSIILMRFCTSNESKRKVPDTENIFHNINFKYLMLVTHRLRIGYRVYCCRGKNSTFAYLVVTLKSDYRLNNFSGHCT